jgi:predicted secreted protein
MATVGAFKGNIVIPNWGGSAIGCTTNFSFEGSNAEVDATCKDNDGAKSTLAGEQTWSFTAEGLQVYDATIGIEDLMTDWRTKQEETIEWSTGVVGDKTYSGTAYISAISMGAPLNGVATWNVTWTGKGNLAETTNV